jgi:ABC-type dipeptide/oligopeptide/nickel transport system permease component
MLGYIASRVLQLLVTLLVITVLVFAMLRLIPGDPAMVIAGTEATPELVARIRTSLGLERPLAVQLAFYLGDVLTGDLGRSIRTGAPVTAEMYPRFVATLQLTLASLLVAVLGGTLVGVVAALHRGRLTDTAILISALAGTSAPSFWVGLVLMIYIGFRPTCCPSPATTARSTWCFPR